MLALFLLLILSAIILISLAYTDKGMHTILSPLVAGEDVADDYGDVIIVFGGGFYNDLGIVTKERLREACRLHKQSGRPIYISEGYLHDPDKFIELVNEFFGDCLEDNFELIFEKESKNTLQNCLNTVSIADTAKFNEIIIVTSPYHQYRVDMILGELLKKDYKISLMKDSEVYSNRSLKGKNRNMRFVLKEYAAIIKDWILLRFY